MRRGCCPDTPGKPDALLQHPHEIRRLGLQDRVALTIEPGERIVVPGSTASSTLMEPDTDSLSTKGFSGGSQERI
jgi:hypothetical protein